MQVPPVIDVKGLPMTPEIDLLLQRRIASLEKVCGYIISLRVAIEKEQGRHQIGNPYRIRLDIRIPPNHELVVRRQPVIHNDVRTSVEREGSEQINPQTLSSDHKEEPLPVAIRRTFDSARRQLQRLVERQRHEIKVHPHGQVMALVQRLFRKKGFGFLRSLDGQEIYFHKNSCLHNEWERLEVGTGVRYTVQEGEKGPQASSIEIVDKPGAREQHQDLHELRVVTKQQLLP